MNFMIKIKCNVSDAIFDNPHINNTMHNLYFRYGNLIKERYDEIYDYLINRGMPEHPILSYENILSFFKGYVKKTLLNDAIVKVLSRDEASYDILDALDSTISDFKFQEYIYGEQMVNAFARAIRSISTDDCIEGISHGSIILLLEKKFLNDRHI